MQHSNNQRNKDSANKQIQEQTGSDAKTTKQQTNGLAENLATSNASGASIANNTEVPPVVSGDLKAGAVVV